MKRYFFILAGLVLLVAGQEDCRSDADGDGYIAMDDCDDNNPDVYPDAEEVCNGIDDDCDRVIDEEFDQDRDGFSVCDVEGNPADCNDDYAGTFPGAPELCDGEDNNCDGYVDEDFDTDNDGWTVCTGDCDDHNPEINPDAVESCDFVDNNCNGKVDEAFDLDADGQSTCGGDCNDADPTVYVGATDRCDGQDNDCNGVTDDDWDDDGDGVTSCGGDCDDTNPSVYGGALEVCDGLDNNCNGATDEGVLPTWYLDADDDGFGDPKTAVVDCVAPSNLYIVKGGDCNDLNPDVNPRELEICNGIDDNCNGTKDEGFDADGDGITTCGGDCNDADANIHPGAPDVCDGIDSNCDGVAETNCAAPVASIAFSVEGEDAGILMNIAYGTEPLTVYFDASGSYDPDGGPLQYQWDFGDGTTATGNASVMHVYYASVAEEADLLAAKVTVTDNEGNPTSKSIGVYVCGSAFPDVCKPRL